MIRKTLAVACLAAASVLARGDAPTKPVLPNVVLISLDTLRSDHLGCYGYARPTSPRIDAFARSATRYTRAVASSPWTLPTHASMFTGQAPFEHQAHTFLEKGYYNIHALPHDRVALAEALAGMGYDTAAFAANQAFLARHWYLDQGFATYVAERVKAREINTRALRWLDERKGRPFFLFLNYMETHRPYDAAPQPRFLAGPVAPDEGALLDELHRIVMPASGPVPADLAQKVIDQYDAAIANVDAALGEFLNRLKKDGRFRDTVIVLTSDHGEYFGEHHLVEHAKDIYQPVISVPLIIRGPKTSDSPRDGTIDDTLVDSSDVPRLIAAHMPSPLRERLAELFPLTPGGHPVISEMHYALMASVTHPEWGHRLRRIRQALFEGPWKYIRSSDERHELYDLSRDPGETVNLVASNPEVASRLARQLEQWLESRRPVTPPAPLVEMDEEDLKRLKSLGYIK